MKNIFLLLGVSMFGMCLFSACSEDDVAVGDSLLGTEIIDVKAVSNSAISIENQLDEKSDLSKNSIGLLGTLNDKVFGKTQVGMAFQLRLQNKISFKEPQVDSVKLFLHYRNYYGEDTTLLQKARVFLLKNDLDYNKKYTNETDINSLIGEEVGQALFNKDLASDTIWLKSKLDPKKDSVIDKKKQLDTLLSHITIKLDNEKVGKYIVNGSEKDFSSGVDFINFFKGLYVKTDDVSGKEGAIYGVNMYTSTMVLYFRDKVTLASGKDTIVNDTEVFPITGNSARFNLPYFTHKAEIKTDDKIYLQGIHGTKAKVEMPSLRNWKDSVNVLINKAELVFKVATDSLEDKKYPLPQRLGLAVVDKEGKRNMLNYSSLAVANLNGLLNMKERTYSFQIPEYLQNLIDGTVTFDHFELFVSGFEQREERGRNGKRVIFAPVDSKNVPARVILHNSGEHKPKLNVTYTKY